MESGRNKARSAAVAAGRVKKADKTDAHHKDGNSRNNESSIVSVGGGKKNFGTYSFFLYPHALTALDS